MKLTKKVLSLILAAALILGTVAVAANAAVVTGLEGSVLTMNITSDKDVADGKAEVKPGEKITVSVYYTTNFYPGNAGVDLFVWTKGVFDDDATVKTMVGADDYWDVLDNFPLSGGYPTDYPASSYTGYLNTRGELTEYVGQEIKVLDNELFYTFEFTVPEDAEIGSVVDFVAPESKIYKGSGSTRGFIRQNVGDSSTYDVVASTYCQTVNVDSLQITVVDESTDEPDTPVVTDPVYGLEGSVLTMDIESDKDVADGKAEVKPGEKITVSVYYTTNFYPGNAGVDLFVWNKGIFDDDATVKTMVGADDYWDVLDNFPLSGGYPTDYPASTYTGYLNTRGELTEYVGQEIKLLNKELFYTFEFTVPEDAEIGSVVDFVAPASKVYKGSGSTRGFIRQNVGDSSTYDVVASTYCETVNVDSLKITVVSDGQVDPPVVEIDYAKLIAKINEVKDTDTSIYTSETAGRFINALAFAQSLVDNAETQDDVTNALSELTNSYNALDELEKVNYEALVAAINEYKALEADKANYSNWAEYDALYEVAAAIDQTVVYDDEHGTIQAKVDAAAKALDEFALVEYGKVNYNALNDAIAAYEEKVADKDNYSNWAEYEALYNEAKAIDQTVVYDKNGEQAAADAAAKALNDFVLVEYAKVDYKALNDAIAAYEAKLPDANTYANWAEYEALYNEAKEIDQTVVYDKNGEQAAVDAAAAALNDFQLEEKTLDYDKWNNAVAEIPADLAGYKPASVTAYEAAKAQAEADKAAAVEALDQTALNAAADALTAAIALLEEKADKSALEAAITRASSHMEGAFTPDSWAAADLANVLAAANVVLADGDATAEAVAEQVAAIEAAEAKLVVKADKAALLEALMAAQGLDADAYTPASWTEANMTAVIDEAAAVYADDNATAEAVANAIAALKAAEAKLVLKADKTALEAAINTEVVLENATAETLAAYNEALAKAQEVYADDNATEEEVLTATNNLLAAIAGLKYYGACDYTAYDDAVKAANDLVADEYTTSSWTAADIAAVLADNAVEEGLMDKDGNQDKINAAAQAINNAIALLEKKADVSALADAVAKDPKVPEQYATVETWTAYAQAKAEAEDILANAADTGVSAQGAVDAAVKALNDANDALAEQPASYTAVEEALALVETKGELNQYTQATVKALEKAIAAVVYDLGISRQDEIDAWAQDIIDAANALEVSKATVTNVKMLGDRYIVRETRQYEVTVNGAPIKIQFVNYKGGTVTYSRDTRGVTVVSYNADGEVINYADEEPAYEVWTVSTSLGEGVYQAKAKNGSVWDIYTYEFEIKLVDPAEDEVYFVAAPADGSAEAGKTLNLKRNAPAVMTVTVPDTVNKMQLFFTLGSKTFTTTYGADSAYATIVDNGDGTWTWTLNRNFSTLGEYTMALKLRDSKGWYDANTEAVAVTVTPVK